jgi:hypothetical protein
MPGPLSAAILSKILQQIERADHLTALLPPDQLTWTPNIAGAWPIGMLLGHLQDCLAGFCAVLAAIHPEKLQHFHELKSRRTNEPVSIQEARDGFALYRAHIIAGFDVLDDADLAQRVPTVFIAEGELALTLLLGNLEHFINHKHQLFLYMKLMGADLASRDLYHFYPDS